MSPTTSKHQDPRTAQAEAEVGTTEITSGHSRCLLLAFLFVVFAVPLFDNSRPARTRGSEGEERAGVRLAAQLPAVGGTLRRRGALAANRALKLELTDFESALERQSSFAAALLPPAQWGLALLRQGNERAYCGVDGWLFFRPSVDSLTGLGFLRPQHHKRRLAEAEAPEAPPQPDPVAAIVDFGRQLEERGIPLLVLPTPSKAAIHPQGLTRRGSRQGLANPDFAAFTQRVEAAGIHLLDPTPLLLQAKRETGEDPYLKTDTHWRPAAVDRVARELAAKVGQLLGLAEPGPVVYRRQLQTLRNIGDITTMLRLPEWQKLYPAEQVTVAQVQERQGFRPTLWRSDPAADLLLLGDSFTNVYSEPGLGWGRSAGLAEQLSHYLGRPVDRLARNAGGAYAARQRLQEELLQGRDRLEGKRLVIYQFAARELFSGDWKILELTPPGPAE